MAMASKTALFQDWQANQGNIKGRMIMVLFRLAHLLRQSTLTFILFLPYFLFYRVFVEWFLGTELPWKTQVGKGLRIDHGQATVVNDNTIFGTGCTLRNGTTIGNKRLRDGSYSASPRFGDNVDIGANAVIIGPITIGSDVAIGAAAVVFKDVPSNCVVVGNPGRAVPR